MSNPYEKFRMRLDDLIEATRELERATTPLYIMPESTPTYNDAKFAALWHAYGGKKLPHASAYSFEFKGASHTVYGTEVGTDALAEFVIDLQSQITKAKRDAASLSRDADAYAEQLALIRKEFQLPSHLGLIDGIRSKITIPPPSRFMTVNFFGIDGHPHSLQGRMEDGQALLVILQFREQHIASATKNERERCIKAMTKKLVDLLPRWLECHQHDPQIIEDMVRRELEAK